jgi:Mn-dependent DtxR family transcriptional regulator
MNIHKSAEDYLEMILRLQESQEYVRAVDISIGLSVTKPSVSVAMRNLKDSGYITIDKDNHIRLTDTGLSIAQKIYERHKLLTDLFTQIGVDPRTAEEDACKVEHDLSSDTFAAIKQVYSRYNSKEA